MAILILVRHGASEWNLLGKWTGLTDVPLAPAGVEEAVCAGQVLKNIQIDIAYSSPLLRAKETLEEIKKQKSTDIETHIDPALNEKNYGDFTGKNKWEVKKQLGEEKFTKVRRSWDYQIPNGESLKNVYERVVPFYEKTILPGLKKGKSILISSSGNTLRALIKYLEHISDEDISRLEVATGEVYMYTLDTNGSIVSKKIFLSHTNTM